MPQIDPTLGTIDPYLPSEIKPLLYYYDEYQTYDLLILDKIDRRITQIGAFNENSILYQLLKGNSELNQVLIERFWPYQNYPYAYNYGLILLDKLKIFASSGWCEPWPLHNYENQIENGTFNLEYESIINQAGQTNAIIHGSFLGFKNGQIIGITDWTKPENLNPETDWIPDHWINNYWYIYVPSKEYFESQGLEITSFYITYLRYDITTEIPEYIWVRQKVFIKNEPYQLNLAFIQPWSLVFESVQISDIVKGVNLNFDAKIKLNWHDQMESDLDAIVQWVNVKLPDIGKILSSVDISINLEINPYWYPNARIENETITYQYNQINYPDNKKYYAYIFANNTKNTNLINDDIISGNLSIYENQMSFYHQISFAEFIYKNANEIYTLPWGNQYTPNQLPNLLNVTVYPDDPNEYFSLFYNYSWAQFISTHTSVKLTEFINLQGGIAGTSHILDIPFLSSFVYEFSNFIDIENFNTNHPEYSNSDDLIWNINYYNLLFTPYKLKITNKQYFNLFSPLWDYEPNWIIIMRSEYPTGAIYHSNAYMIDRQLNILSDINFNFLGTDENNNYLYDQDTYTLSYTDTISRQLTDNYLPLIQTDINEIIAEIDQKYYNYYLDENNKIEFYNSMPDSTRIKEIHASLQADKFSKDDDDPNVARVANLGYLIERLSRIWGISVNSDGSIRSIRQKRHIAVDDPNYATDDGVITFPAGWSFGQFSINYGGGTDGQLGGNPDEERDGIIYEVRSNYFNADENPDKILEGGYLLCENWPQYLDSLLDDLDKALGWQNAGANVMTTADGTKNVLFEGLYQMCAELAYTLSDLSVNIKQNHVLSNEIQSEIKELIGIMGLPTTLKSKDFDIGDVQSIGKIPYIGFDKSAPTLFDLITVILTNLSLLNNAVLTADIKEEDLI